MDAEVARREQLVAWALAYEHSVMLRTGGQPWSFESRTAGGRRRLFPVRTADWVMAVVVQVARSRRAATQAVRDAWVEQWNAVVEAENAAKVAAGRTVRKSGTVTLTKVDPRTGRTVSLDARELEKVFEDREMRNNFVAFLTAAMSAQSLHAVHRYAMADRVRAMGNQYRNHPIQGGVADAVLIAFDRIDADLSAKFPTAVGIQSVHDSIVVECNVEDAAAVRDLVVKHMQEALATFCPNVPCVADGDIQVNLAGTSALDEGQLSALVSAWDLAA
jgi:hypothetical protein